MSSSVQLYGGGYYINLLDNIYEKMPTQRPKVKQQSKTSSKRSKKEPKPVVEAVVTKKTKSWVREDGKSLAYITGYVEGYYNKYFELTEETEFQDSFEAPAADEYATKKFLGIPLISKIQPEYQSGQEKGILDAVNGDTAKYTVQDIWSFPEGGTYGESLPYILGYTMGHGSTGDMWDFFSAGGGGGYRDIYNKTVFPEDVEAGYLDGVGHRKKGIPGTYSLVDVAEFTPPRDVIGVPIIGIAVTLLLLLIFLIRSLII